MNGDLEDFDCDCDDTVPVPLKPANFWIIVSAFFELLATVCKAGGRFFDTVEDEFLTKWRFDRQQRAFRTEASQAIEMIATGRFDATTDATSRSIGTGRSESPN